MMREWPEVMGYGTEIRHKRNERSEGETACVFLLPSE